MKTFNEFITEARISKKQRAFNTVKRVAKRAVTKLSRTKPARSAARYVGATAAGAALKLLTGL